jgi:phage tail sheath protein FI
MATFTVSPGVSISELDRTFLTGQPSQAGAAIIGPTVKGPWETPTIVTSYSQYVGLFGDSFISGGINYSYLTSISAYNYFNYGGSSLLVARVASGSFTPATSSINSSTALTPASINVPLTYISASLASVGSQSLDINGITLYYTGSATTPANTSNIIYINTASFSNPIIGVEDYVFSSSAVLAFSSSITLYTSSLQFISSSISSSTNLLLTSTTPNGLTGNSYYVISGSTTSYFTGGTNISSFTLETISEGIIMNNSGSTGANGTLLSGSLDNVRIETTNVNTTNGTFTLLVRQGNDTSIQKSILETFSDLSLDPNSNRYISKVIGDQKLKYSNITNQMELTGNYPNNSMYIRVKNVITPTPNYLNSNGNISNNLYSGSLPFNQNESFSTATGTVASNVGTTMYDNIGVTTQGLIANDYNNMINLLSNQSSYQFNVLFTPGLINNHHTSQISTIISNTQNRADNLYILDLIGYDGTVATIVPEANSRDTSYAASYWPWVRIICPATGKRVWVPASTVIPGVYAFNDKISAPWFAPAGINRGGLSTVLQSQFQLTQGQKDTLYSNNINPLATLPKNGVVVFGQKTLQKQQSALDRINVRRLLIELKNYIRQIADTIVFEQNTSQTRGFFFKKVNPFLEGIQQKQGLYAYKIIMDDSNNGPAVIDQNQLIGQIYIQPTRTAEFISLDFILLPTGAEFPG